MSMDWKHADAATRQAYRLNGRNLEQPLGFRTPLTDLISKDPCPDLDEMTTQMLCEFAADHHIAVGEDAAREEIIEAIKVELDKNWEERVLGMVNFLDYSFSEGPHPLLVIRRVIGVLRELRPGTFFKLEPGHVRIIFAGDHQRLREVFEAERAGLKWDSMDAAIREAFQKKSQSWSSGRRGMPLVDLLGDAPEPDYDGMTELMLCDFAADHHIPIGEDAAREEIIEIIRFSLERNGEERRRAIGVFLDYLFEEGLSLIAVIRRLFAIVKAVRPQVLFNMSCAKIAVLCADGNGRTCDGRATVSARVDRVFEEPIRQRGMKGFKAGFQKTETANNNYSHAAQGNQNRLGRDFLALSANRTDSSNGENGHAKKTRKEAA